MTSITISFIIGITLIVLAYDVWALYKSKTNEYTISYIIAKASMRNPIIPFLFGGLMAHFFFGVNLCQ